MHTPGPWDYERLFRDAGNHPGDHYTIDDDFLTIIIAGEDDDFDPDKHNWIVVYGPNQEANARLIAAAPELLESLEEMYNLIAREHLLNETVAKAAKAIRKAKEK